MVGEVKICGTFYRVRREQFLNAIYCFWHLIVLFAYTIARSLLQFLEIVLSFEGLTLRVHLISGCMYLFPLSMLWLLCVNLYTYF